jgi:hypothetical protein
VSAEGRSSSVIAVESATVVQVLDLVGLEAEQSSSLADLAHPVTAYLTGWPFPRSVRRWFG